MTSRVDLLFAMEDLTVTDLRERLEQPLTLLQQHGHRLEKAITEGLAANHRAANSVMALALSADTLASRARAAQVPATIVDGLEAVSRQLSHAGKLVSQVRHTLSAGTALAVESVHWRPVLEAFSSQHGLALDLAPDLPATISCAKGAHGLSRILAELAANVPPGATARIELRAVEDVRVKMALVDDGPGLAHPAEEVTHPFVGRAQADGLGLFIVDCLARASGARVRVEALEQGGTSVAVCFMSAGATVVSESS